MQWIRYAFVALLVAAIGGIPSFSADMDVRTLQAKMAAQEAGLNDLEAKLRSGAGGRHGDAADGITSLRKNAVVTVGGYVNTGYYYQRYKADSIYTFDSLTGAFSDSGDGYRRRADARSGNLEIVDTDLYVDVRVNDHFDAFLHLDPQNVNGDDYGVAKAYWIRWKNVCNTGFGLKVGRDRMVFGNEGYGYLDSFAASGGDGIDRLGAAYFSYYSNILGGSGADRLGPVPLHNHWKTEGVTQITPYWEGLDGRLLWELSFMQSVDNQGTRRNIGVDGSIYVRHRDGVIRYRTRNDGFGTFSTRVAYSPIEDLKFTASFVNYYSKSFDNYQSTPVHTKNNSAFSLSVDYRPCFVKPLNLWAQWIHGWNVSNFKGLDSDVVNFGASWDLTGNLTVFMQGDYLRSTFDHRHRYFVFDNRGTAWAAYGGLMYALGGGAVLEAGWRHEQIECRENGVRATKFKGDTIYANIGFEF